MLARSCVKGNCCSSFTTPVEGSAWSARFYQRGLGDMRGLYCDLCRKMSGSMGWLNGASPS